ncbi:glycoside hydrolase family 76 protein [Viridothelium virens]|uniref:Glycoside hydrolase family 76 protein n=1 Tax=Viridothelium virens TaxID=1048519 RepID=A0A6A6H1C1_VIRVR|nr:glycoside hydrolase family 76 protein [Viridothelium virens]
MLKSSIQALVALLAVTSHSISVSDAELSFNTLQQWYNQSIGLWIPSTAPGWWNSANCLTVVADLAAIDSNVKTKAESIFPRTFEKAQAYNLQQQKGVGTNWLPWSYYGNFWPWFPLHHPKPPFHHPNGFLNSYYDDEGWWALAWIAVYDVTGDTRYLHTAESIFQDMAASYDTTPCGGIWWDKNHTYVNAIANELFLSVGAHLANRAPSKSSYYLRWAQREWAWFQSSGMINAQNTINDGLNLTTCRNNNGTVWSYNQGVVLGALAELNSADSEENSVAYLSTAKRIADAAIANLTDANGVLHDPCEPDCGADGSQFKGVFARNLQRLQQASPEVRYKTFLQDNANAIWADDRGVGNELSVVWSGPFVSPANASTQSSAMDAIVGALTVS